MIWPAIALMLSQAQPTPPRDFAPVETRSADGGALARIDRAPGQENVAANMARFALTVYALDASNQLRELWNSPYPYDSSPAKYVLANRGRAFVEIEEHFSESHTVLMVQAKGRELVKWSGAELQVPREKLGGTNLKRTWLDERRAPSIDWVDGAFGPCLQLEIPCRGEFVRQIDLERTRLLDSTIDPITPRVEPAIEGTLPTRNAIPYVQSVEFARVARAGREVEVKILGNHATPGWTFLGFELETGGDKLVLTPRSQAPEGIAAQVLTVFRATARLHDLRVGRYTLEVSGWSSRGASTTIDVVPETLLASLRTSGGFAGIDQIVELYDQGLSRWVSNRVPKVRFAELSGEPMERLRQLIAALPAKSRRARTENSADLFEHTLGFWSAENWITIEVDDLAATEAERELIQALREN